jgi:hypothetical protein
VAYCGFSRYLLNGIPKFLFPLGLHVMFWGPVALQTLRFSTAIFYMLGGRGSVSARKRDFSSP